MSFNYDTWAGLFASRQCCLLPADLKRSLEYLVRTRNDKEGWGDFPSLATELHPSVLAAEALHLSRFPEYNCTVADTILFFKNKYASRLEELSIDELNDLLLLAYAEDKPDEDFAYRVLSCIIDKYNLNNNVFSTKVVATTLQALAYISSSIEFKRIVESQLCNLQSPEDGGWGVSQGKKSTLISTAFAISALCTIKSESSADHVNRGIKFLKSIITAEGWSGLGGGNNTFVLAVVLRTFAGNGSLPYEMMIEGVDYLKSFLNTDFGWGGGRNEKSNTECTSIAIAALIANGENLYIPTKLAKSALENARSNIYKLKKESDEIRLDIDEKIRNQSGHVLQERDTLRKEIVALKQENKALKAEQDAQKRFILSFSNSPSHGFSKLLYERHKFEVLTQAKKQVYLFCFFFCVVTAYVLLNHLYPSLSDIVSIALIVILFIGGVATFLSLRARIVTSGDTEDSQEDFHIYSKNSFDDRIPLSYKDEYVSDLRLSFYKLTETWPAIMREEIVYRLLSDVIEMPDDIGPRYVEDLTFRLDMPMKHRNSLRRWLLKLLRLDPPQRRVILDQIRRSILK